MRFTFALSLALLAAAPAASATPDTRLADALKGRTAGKPVSCINLRQADRTSIIDERTILYRAGRTTYVNRLPDACPGLQPHRAIVSRTTTPSLCQGEIVTIIDPPVPGEFGSCVLAEFTPYRR